MKTSRFFRYLMSGFFILSSGCTSSLLTSSWVAPNSGNLSLKSVVVVAIIPDDDHLMRAKMEKHLTADLRNMGISAISSYESFGPKFIDNTNESEVTAMLRGKNTEAVLTVVLLSKEKEKYYVPGRVYYSPYYIRHRRFWGYYSTIYERVYEPGYYIDKTNFFWESNLFLTSTNDLLYSSQTRSFDPSNIESMAHEYGKMICNDLNEKGILKIQ
jgi:hypothetical protein